MCFANGKAYFVARPKIPIPTPTITRIGAPAIAAIHAPTPATAIIASAGCCSRNFWRLNGGGGGTGQSGLTQGGGGGGEQTSGSFRSQLIMGVQEYCTLTVSIMRRELHSKKPTIKSAWNRCFDKYIQGFKKLAGGCIKIGAHILLDSSHFKLYY